MDNKSVKYLDPEREGLRFLDCFGFNPKVYVCKKNTKLKRQKKYLNC